MNQWRKIQATCKTEKVKDIVIVGELPPIETKIIVRCRQERTVEKEIHERETYFLSEFARNIICLRWHIVEWKFTEPKQVMAEGVVGSWFKWVTI